MVAGGVHVHRAARKELIEAVVVARTTSAASAVILALLSPVAPESMSAFAHTIGACAHLIETAFSYALLRPGGAAVTSRLRRIGSSTVLAAAR